MTPQGWGPGERPAGLYEVPGQYPRFPVGANPISVEAAQQSGRASMSDRVIALGRKGWRVDATSRDRVQMSAPSYRLHPLLTILLIFCTLGFWILPAAWLQGSKRRDECLLTLGPDWRLIEIRTRGW